MARSDDFFCSIYPIFCLFFIIWAIQLRSIAHISNFQLLIFYPKFGDPYSTWYNPFCVNSKEYLPMMLFIICEIEKQLSYILCNDNTYTLGVFIKWTTFSMRTILFEKKIPSGRWKQAAFMSTRYNAFPPYIILFYLNRYNSNLVN